jgi:hypothetical protein
MEESSSFLILPIHINIRLLQQLLDAPLMVLKHGDVDGSDLP